MSNRSVALLLFFVVSLVYYATTAGITSSNDGSHYALVRAITDEQQFSINTYAHFAEGNDIAVYDNTIYSDRPPGTAILATPFYLLGGVLPPPIRNLATRHDEGNSRLAYLMMLPVLAGSATAVLLFILLRCHYNLSRFAAITTSLFFAFGSTSWKYSTVLYSHQLSALVILGSLLIVLITAKQKTLTPLVGLLLGTLLGLSILIDYSHVLVIPIFASYIVIILKHNLLANRALFLSLLLCFIGIAAFSGFLLYYNTINFGSPFHLSYKYAINYPWAGSFITTFDIPLSQGLPAMLWYGTDGLNQENQGMFLLMPITLVGIIGTLDYIKKYRAEATFVIGVFFFFLLLYATHHSFSGFTFDGRYLSPFLALWFIPVAFLIERVYLASSNPLQPISFFVVYGLAFLSIRNVFVHIAYSYNYHLDPSQVARRSAIPANWEYILTSVFLNWQNLPLLLGVYSVFLAVTLVSLGVSKDWRKKYERS